MEPTCIEVALCDNDVIFAAIVTQVGSEGFVISLITRLEDVWARRAHWAGAGAVAAVMMDQRPALFLKHGCKLQNKTDRRLEL